MTRTAVRTPRNALERLREPHRRLRGGFRGVDLRMPRPWTPLRAAADPTAMRTVRWVGALFLLEVLLQRFQVPGRPVALLLPVLFAWAVLAVKAGVLEVDARRAMLWSVMTASSGTALILQTALLPAPLISTNSWMLFIAVWMPAVLRMRDRRLTTYLLAVRRIIAICTGLAAACTVMMASQLVGVGYRDYVAEIVPSTFLLENFVITYPLQFGSAIVRSNAWIGLEPSIVSYLLGLGLLAAILTRAPWWQSAVLAVGLVTVYAASGFLVVIVGALVALAFPARRRIAHYTLPAAGLVALVYWIPLTRPLIMRASGELSDVNSSASLRATMPYEVLWPRWSGDPLGILLGRGAGSAQRYAEYLSIDNLLVPTLARVLFDYGLVAGAVIIAVLVFFYLDGPSAAIAVTSFVSLWAVQPGGNQVVFTLPVLLLITFFAPRVGPRIEENLALTAKPAPQQARPAPAERPARAASGAASGPG